MGREVRMVPPDWQHQKDEQGNYRPLHKGPFSERLREWDEGKAKWDQGLVTDWRGGWRPKQPDDGESFGEWSGQQRPQAEDYMPDFPVGTATHLQMYEDTSEGTPISPPMPDAESLARWLADNGASAFAGRAATYEQWLATIKAGWAPSMAAGPAAMMSGVEYTETRKTNA